MTTTLIAIPWSLRHVGGVNEVVRNLLLYLHQHPELGRPVLMSPGDTGPISLSSDCKVESVCLPWVEPPVWWRLVRWAGYLLKFHRRVDVWRRFMDSDRVSVVHIHPGDVGLTVMAVAAARRAVTRPRVTVSFHGFDVDDLRASGRFRKLAIARLLKRVDTINVCSVWLKNQLSASGLVEPSRINVCHNAIDMQMLDRECVDNAVYLPGDGRLVLCVGTYERKKGIDVLIEAFDTVAKMVPDARLVVAGRPGPESAELLAEARRSPFSARIHLIGPIKHGELLGLFRRCVVLALPSRREPFGIVLLEAAWASVPVVATRVGGVPEIVEDGYSGLLVESEDHRALAAALMSVLSDGQLADKLATNARRRVLRDYSWDVQAPRYLGIHNAPNA